MQTFIWVSLGATITIFLGLLIWAIWSAGRALTWEWLSIRREMIEIEAEESRRRALNHGIILRAQAEYLKACVISDSPETGLQTMLIDPRIMTGMSIVTAQKGYDWTVPGLRATHYAPHNQSTRTEVMPPPPSAQIPPAAPVTMSIERMPSMRFDPSIFLQIPNNLLMMATGINDATGDLDMIDIDTASHMFVAGNSGQGKSTLIAFILMAALARNAAERLKVWFLDCENITSPAFAPYAFRYARRPADIIAALREVAKLVDTRAELISSRKMRLKELPDYHFIFIEEALKLMLIMTNEEKKEYLALLQNIAVSARKTGIYLLLTAQTLRASGSDAIAVIRDQCNFKMSGALSKEFMVKSLEFADDAILEKVCAERKRGQFVRMIDGKNALIRTLHFDLDDLPDIVPTVLKNRQPFEQIGTAREMPTGDKKRVLELWPLYRDRAKIVDVSKIARSSVYKYYNELVDEGWIS